jgi:hypothetical protein
MRSSISNSDGGAYAARILCCFVLISAAYALVVHLHPWRRPVAESQWMQNLLTAEAFQFGEERKPAVLVGSSLSGSIATGNLANLAFASRTANEGLALLARRSALPQVVCVEINVPPERQLDREAFVGTGWSARIPAPPRFNRGLAENLVDVGRRDRLVKALAASYLRPPDPTALRAQAAELAQRIRALQARGCRVLLVELPIEPELAELPRPEAIRRAVQGALPEVPVFRPQLAGTLTSDGIHLTQEARESVGHQLDEAVRRLLAGDPPSPGR